MAESIRLGNNMRGNKSDKERRKCRECGRERRRRSTCEKSVQVEGGKKGGRRWCRRHLGKGAGKEEDNEARGVEEGRRNKRRCG